MLIFETKYKSFRKFLYKLLFVFVLYVDSIGLHRVENVSHSDTAASLHVYIPAFDMCQSFDQRTGHKRKCQVTFCSKYGQRTPYVSIPFENCSYFQMYSWNTSNLLLILKDGKGRFSLIINVWWTVLKFFSQSFNSKQKMISHQFVLSVFQEKYSFKTTWACLALGTENIFINILFLYGRLLEQNIRYCINSSKVKMLSLE